jgi:hypothetical protein
LEYKIVNTKFPNNPRHGDIYEVKSGLLYQYDAGVNGWLEVRSDNFIIELATPIKKGAMSSEDLRKLNRLLLPPPQSTITGTDCPTPFQYGTVQLYSGDRFVGVDGNVDIRNINEFGDIVSTSHPFHIHQHTYGFDFTLDIPELVRELISRGKLNLQGLVGDTGDKGDTGDDGINNILSGPAGNKGTQGLAPPCDLIIDPEPINAEARPGLKRALVTARLIDNTDKSFILEFDRQVVGSQALSTSSFNVRDSNSFWVLAVTNVAGNPQPVYYIDIEPLIDIVRSKFLSEVHRLKKGYEDIVRFWIQTMSDLFDEQKAALCCALEYCMSATKSIDQRWHMESVAAAVVGSKGARINLHSRDSDVAVEISSTSLLPRLPDGKDLCAVSNDDGDAFVHFDALIISDTFDNIIDNFPCGSTSTFGTGANSRGKTSDIIRRPVLLSSEEDIKTYLPNVYNIYKGSSSPSLNSINTGIASVAIGPNTRLQVYSERGFNGVPYIDVIGPYVIYSRDLTDNDIQLLGCSGEPISVLQKLSNLTLRPWEGDFKSGSINDAFGPSNRVVWPFSDWCDRKPLPRFKGDVNNAPQLIKDWCEDGLAVSGPARDKFPTWVNGTLRTSMGLWLSGSIKITYVDPIQGQVTKTNAIDDEGTRKGWVVVVDPLLNTSSAKTASTVELPKGRYTATITATDVKIADKFGLPIKIQYAENGDKRVIQFLDKGRFGTLEDARNSYQGLTIAFNHDGGMVYLYYPIIPSQNASGSSTVYIEHTQGFARETLEIYNSADSFSCFLSNEHLNLYKDLWDSDNRRGVVMNIGGQDYIIVGSSASKGASSIKCAEEAFELLGKYPAFAWPTFDGKSFVLPPNDGNIRFVYDESINNIVSKKTSESQFSLVLFPAS